MPFRLTCCLFISLFTVSTVVGQEIGGGNIRKWRAPTGDHDAIRLTSRPSDVGVGATEDATKAASIPAGAANFLSGDQGQILRQYDISSYTLRAQTKKRPQQAIVDWILRDTGYETWHAGTLALLNATSRTLHVYHTPDVQRQVAEIVQRFVNPRDENLNYSFRIATIGHPDWRSRAQKLLQPVPLQSQGAEAWLLAKEDAAMLLADLAKRSDFRNHGSPRMIVNNGRTAAIALGRKRQFTRSMMAPGGDPTGRQPNTAEVDEGISLELSPLLSVDGNYVDALIKCKLTQVEKTVAVKLESPRSTSLARHWYSIEVPQLVSREMHERFRWPRDKVLLISLGVGPRPIVENKSPLNLGLSTTPPRGDTLIFVDSTGKTLRTDVTNGAIVPQQESFRGRY
jgi:hypothetical protein